MKIRINAIALVFLIGVPCVSGCLFGREYDFGKFGRGKMERFGDGGVFSVKSSPDVFDFSRDGKYLWLSETDAYDLATGRKVDAATLKDESLPLPRMQWKKRILGGAWNWWLSSNELNFQNQAIRWLTDKGLFKGSLDPDDIRRPTVTFSPKSAPIVTGRMRTSAYMESWRFMVGVFSEESDEIKFIEAAKILPGVCSLRMVETAPSMSVTMKRCAAMYNWNGNGFSFSDIHIGTGRDGVVEFPNYVLFDSVPELEGGDGPFIQEFGGFGFLDDNYFAFAAKRGGMRSFTARNYLLVYGFREKRIVKVFRSKLWLWGEGYHINDVDVVLSDDEKYLAIRYDGVLTVYPFLTDGGVFQ